MSEFLTTDNFLIKNLESLIRNNTDFNVVEDFFFTAGAIFGLSESQNQSTLNHQHDLENIIRNISNGRIKITAQNAELIYLDINDWISEKIGLGLFSEDPFSVFEHFTKDQQTKLFENSGETVLKIFMDRGHIWKIRDVGSGDKEIYPQKLIFKQKTDNFQTPFVDYVAKMVKDGTLDGFTSKIISEITREDYSFNKFQRDIAKIINDFIVSSAD